MPSQPFPASWLAGLTVRNSMLAPTANNHDAAAYEEREESAGWRIIPYFRPSIKKESVHTDGIIRACRKYQLPALTMLVLAKENVACPEKCAQNGRLNAATAGGFR